MAPLLGRRILGLQYIRDTILTPTVIGLVTYYLASRFRLPYKPLLVAFCVVVGWPVKFSLRVRYDSWRRARRARDFGAVSASESCGKLFGNADVANEMHEMSRNGLIGTFLSLTR